MRQRHVLIVDDNVELAETYRELLEVFEYRASVVPSVAQAVKFVSHTPVDAVLCDLNMPIASGDVFYRALGNTNPELREHFIFVTGSLGCSSSYDSFLNTVNCPVLHKPVSIQELTEALGCLFTKPID